MSSDKTEKGLTSNNMGKQLGPQCKLCRRAGEKLLLKGDRCSSVKCAIVKRNFPPGFHGPKGANRRASDYSAQLSEKQKAKRTYGMLEKQFYATFESAQKIKGNTAENLAKLLEMRLDNVVYRLSLGSSRAQARQLVSHGHIMVNGRKMDIASYTVKQGDQIKVKDSKTNSKFHKDSVEKLKKAQAPGWLNFDKETLSAKVLHMPTAEDIKTNFNAQMIIEFYSR